MRDIVIDAFYDTFTMAGLFGKVRLSRPPKAFQRPLIEWEDPAPAMIERNPEFAHRFGELLMQTEAMQSEHALRDAEMEQERLKKLALYELVHHGAKY
jgi:hypothetical protein